MAQVLSLPLYRVQLPIFEKQLINTYNISNTDTLYMDELIDERTRAEDILLGSLGFGQEARVISIVRTPKGYKGVGSWTDGEEFEFSCEDELDELQEWALSLMVS